MAYCTQSTLMDDQNEYKERKAKLAEEEKQVKKDLEALKARTLNWTDLAIKTFNFAKNAKYHFEHGTYEDKTLVLRTLGSNFYILDGKLCVDLIKPFLIFKEHQLDVQATFETIELPNFAMVGANTDDFEHWFVKWSGWSDSNARPHGPKPRTLPTELHPGVIKS